LYTGTAEFGTPPQGNALTSKFYYTTGILYSFVNRKECTQSAGCRSQYYETALSSTVVDGVAGYDTTKVHMRDFLENNIWWISSVTGQMYSDRVCLNS
jgi:hypothetical protein